MPDNRDRQQQRGRGGQQQRQHELNVSLVTSPPVRIGRKKWETVVIIATVLRGKLAPRPSRNVVLSINGAQVGAPKATDMESGDATFVFTPSAAGIYAIKVYVVDFPSAQAVKHIMVEDREPTAEERELVELFRKAEAANLQRKIREAQGQPTDPDVEAAKKAAEIAKHQAEKAEAEDRVRKATPPKPKAKPPELKLLSTVVKGEVLTVTLARLGEEGGLPGSVYYTDVDPDSPAVGATFLEEPAGEKGIAVVDLPFLPVKRKVTFFLPERPDEKIEVEVPARPRETRREVSEVAGKIESATSRIATAFRRGRDGKSQGEGR